MKNINSHEIAHRAWETYEELGLMGSSMLETCLEDSLKEGGLIEATETAAQTAIDAEPFKSLLVFKKILANKILTKYEEEHKD